MMILLTSILVSLAWLLLDDLRGNPRPPRQLTQSRTLTYGVEIPMRKELD